MPFFSLRAWSRSIILAGMMLTTAACGNRVISPLQSNTSPVGTATVGATANPNASPTVTPNLIATAAARSASTTLTPSTKSTSDAVLATVTALAATPTKIATNTPRPNRTPISAGPNDTAVPNPATQTGTRIESFSAQVFRGGAAAVSLRTKPAAQCGLFAVRTQNGTIRLEPVANVPLRTAGSDGGLAWIWTIGANEATGKLTLEVQCGDAGAARFEIRVES
ncbi:MAG: hypothetical protein KIH69_023140 [Anaerolineae bacterium]|nr:hypothetical protein [Anaerolineae bacterium]